MPYLIVLGLLLAAGFALVQRLGMRERSVERLRSGSHPANLSGAAGSWRVPVEAIDAGGKVQRERQAGLSYPRRYKWVAWVLACASAAALFWMGAGTFFSVSISVVALMLGYQIESWGAERQGLKIEAQLIDAVDIMVSCLYAGGGVSQALRAAQAEAKAPLKQQIREIDFRVRLGDEPRLVYFQLSERVPLESFRLFSATLAVHHEAGGSVAPALAAVGQAIRDRAATARRLQAATALARATTIALVFIIVFVFLLIWRNDPARMQAFLNTMSGRALLALSIVLVGIGIAWQARQSRL